MADAVVSPLLKALYKRLDSLADASDYNHALHLRDVLGKLEPLAREVEQQLGNNESIKLWLKQLKEIAYDADDLVDRWEVLTMKKTSFIKRKVLDFFSLNNSLAYRMKIMHQKKILLERFQQVLEDGTKFGTMSDPRSSESLPSSTSIPFNTHPIYGRDHEKAEILLRLLGNDDHQKVRVIPIVGMGGIGKTTLAQLIYNHFEVNMNFNFKRWVAVGEYFDLRRIGEAILSALTFSSHNLSIDQLGRRILELLEGKKFLIVLDDVWSVDSHNWEVLRIWFSGGAFGSAVIVTTRRQDVARSMTDDGLCLLSGLSVEDSWHILASATFRSTGPNAELEVIGKRIVRKCGGLPLAIKIVGSLLYCRTTVREWLSILDSEAWSSFDSGVLPVLKLSYDHLPPHLKQCFAYCSVFPRNYEISKETLIRLWIAEGFVEPDTGRELEDTAEDYLVQLLHRSFFVATLIDDNGNLVKCQMHDLVHDLAQFVSGIEYSMLGVGYSQLVSENVRHISLVCESGGSTNSEMIYRGKNLRTFLSFSGNFEKTPLIFQNFGSLRVLDISRSGIRELPVTISALKHLRYLNLSHTYIRSIPESIRNLKHLQTLEIFECYNLLELPKALCGLMNLRHLDIRSCSLTHMPSGIGKLRSLQTLPAFILGEQADCAKLFELGDLDIRGQLDIKNLENVRHPEHAQQAGLSRKLRLHSLGLSWGLGAHCPAGEVLRNLVPSPNLKALNLTGFSGSQFPSWIASHLPNLVKLSLTNCSCPELPPLGLLPLLMDLHIKGMGAVHTIGDEFYGNSKDVAFPALRQLKLYDMPNLLEWNGFKVDGKAVSFPCLDTLTVKGCSWLTGLPSIPHLKNLALWHSNEVLLSSLVHLTSLSTLVINELRGPRTFPWDLQNLNTIKQLTVHDCDNLESLFEGLKVFSSLEHLGILYCQELKSLPMEVSYLASLKKFDIVGCEQLADIPDIMQHLSSLEELAIEGCPMLCSLPNIPVSLKKLIISRCPILEKRLERENGQDWFKISHIPYVEIESGEYLTKEGNPLEV